MAAWERFYPRCHPTSMVSVAILLALTAAEGGSRHVLRDERFSLPPKDGLTIHPSLYRPIGVLFPFFEHDYSISFS